MNLYWNSRWYHVYPHFHSSTSHLLEIQENWAQTCPAPCPLFFACPCSYKVGLPSLHLYVFPRPSIFYLLHPLGEKHCLFQVLQEIESHWGYSLWVFIVLLKTGAVGGNIHLVELLRVSCLSPLRPHSLVLASLDFRYQTLPDLLSSLGSLVQFTS